MPRLNAETLLRAVESGDRGGVFFLHGDESHLKGELTQRLIAAHLDPATRDFNLDQLHGNDVEGEAFASILNTPPMMAEWRVVVLRDAQALAGAARTRAIVEDLLGRATPGLALILVADIPQGSKAAFYERLKKEARSVELAALSAADVPGWLIERAEADGITMDPAAARALAVAIGAELGVLSSEMNKLRDYVGERRRITVEDVEAVVGPVLRQNRWEWLDMVANGKLREARAALGTLFDAGETGVGLVIALGTHFLRLALAAHGGKSAIEQALPRQQAWLAGRLMQQARGWTAPALEGALEDLLRADRLLKSAPLGQQEIIEEVLLRLEARRGALV